MEQSVKWEVLRQVHEAIVTAPHLWIVGLYKVQVNYRADFDERANVLEKLLAEYLHW